MLRCFCAVADHGSLADAADVLGRTPSAVSMMLRQFEDHIGAPLFEGGRKARLTPLGELIRIEAGRELDHFGRTEAAIEGLSKARLGHVRLAVTPSVAQVVMPAVLRRFVAGHPGVHIDMRDTDSAAIRKELEGGHADIGIGSLPASPDFERTLLFRDRFGVVCPADHPLTENWMELGWSDLAETGFIANGLCQYIHDPDFAPILAASRLDVLNTASILSLVRAGVGVTVLPELAVLPGFADLAFLPLAGSDARREVWIATQPKRLLTPAARALTAAILQADISAGHTNSDKLK